jgi:hypothetical protein
MRGHYFKVEYVKHLPFVAGAMIDSHTTAEYWKNRTRERLGYVTNINLYAVLFHFRLILDVFLYHNRIIIFCALNVLSAFCFLI